ncbi:MAG: glycoside hydrolase family 3 protein [Lachnospiraceae bacterium]|nr:glycoside hydrolase family 3 protein [Lachnospiraceae bacterium]
MITQTDFISVKYIRFMIIILTLAVLTGCGTVGVNVSMSGDKEIDVAENASTLSEGSASEDEKNFNHEEDKEISEARTSEDKGTTISGKASNGEETSRSEKTNEDDGSSENTIPASGKTTSKELQLEYELRSKLASMTLEEKVAQLFIVFPESLVPGVSNVTMAGDATRDAITKTPVGGIIYMNENIRNPEQIKTMIENSQKYSMDRIGLPLFICVDEEGGQIARIANNRSFGVSNVGSMSDIGVKGDTDIAFVAGANMGAYLSELGFNLDFAPVADVKADGFNSMFSERSFSEDPKVVSSMANALSKGLESKGILSVYKHFPGHGSTTGDPHKGYAFTNKTMDELKSVDIIPFKKGIEEGVPIIMVGHISLPNIISDGTPASVSKEIVTGVLREEMNYSGVVITDAMNMGAIKDRYEADEAALKAINAGVDIVLMSKDFYKAYDGILQAVESGTLTEERIDESVTRILRLKLKNK